MSEIQGPRQDLIDRNNAEARGVRTQLETEEQISKSMHRVIVSLETQKREMHQVIDRLSAENAALREAIRSALEDYDCRDEMTMIEPLQRVLAQLGDGGAG